MAKSNGKDAFAFPCRPTGTTSAKPRSTEGVVVLFRPRRGTHLAAAAAAEAATHRWRGNGPERPRST
jgi:hypothetical protein